MTTEIICALISTGGAILSAGIAWRVSSVIATKEMKKLQATWVREDSVNADDEFSNMSGAVSNYIASGHRKDRSAALSHIGTVRARSTSNGFRAELKALHDAIQQRSIGQDLDIVSARLTEVLEKKRKG